MKLHERTIQNSLAKKLAPALSRLVSGKRRISFLRKLVAYANFLIGKGAGTGWDLDSETGAAKSVIFRDEPVIFDVGGNIGSWSKKMREQIEGGSIYIFEPQPTCQTAIVNLKLTKVNLVPAVVSETAGESALITSSDTDGTASLHRREDSYFENLNYNEIRVKAIVLDEFITEKGIEFVDFVKMDIEGHEFSALKGLRKSIENARVGAFSFEFGSGNLNSRTCFRDFWQLLSPRFHLFRITPGKALIKVQAYYEDLEYFRGATNYLALLKDHPYAAHGLDKLSYVSEF